MNFFLYLKAMSGKVEPLLLRVMSIYQIIHINWILKIVKFKLYDPISFGTELLNTIKNNRRLNQFKQLNL